MNSAMAALIIRLGKVMPHLNLIGVAIVIGWSSYIIRRFEEI